MKKKAELPKSFERVGFINTDFDMKFSKIKLHELANADLDEQEMCRLLGRGTPGCCQCGCNYAGQPGGSSTSANSSANNAHGYVSDIKEQPCCNTGGSNSGGGTPIHISSYCTYTSVQDNILGCK